MSDEYIKNLKAYSQYDTVESYASASYLTEAEEKLFKKYLFSGMRVLDLGVGGGRTSKVLSIDASEYIGIDYSEEMVVACRKRFPYLQFKVMDASDLHEFSDLHFDLVVFSYNGLGYLHPEEKVIECLKECYRVLKPGGKLIFSLHYSRSLFHRMPRIEGVRGIRPIVGSLKISFTRFFRRICGVSFWSGAGYTYSDAHGGLIMYTATPLHIRSVLHRVGFFLEDILGDDFPRKNFSFATRWYYYAAIRMK
jgi:SAM-dependent methyltransferase